MIIVEKINLYFIVMRFFIIRFSDVDLREKDLFVSFLLIIASLSIMKEIERNSGFKVLLKKISNCSSKFD